MLDKILEQFNSALADLEEFVVNECAKRDHTEEKVAQLRADISNSTRDIDKANRVTKKIAKLIS